MATRRLVFSIALESGVGLQVVLAAGLMTSLPPAMHEQPLWPFPSRPSLDAVREDGDLMQEAVLAGSVMLVAAVIIGAGFLRGWRVRWGLAAAGLAAIALAVPHLDLLLAEAHPTQFWRSPTGFASSSIAEGAALYPAHCAGCHGAAGRGDGPAGEGLRVRPADLTAGHLWAHEDGELFWWLAHGIEAPRDGLAMPGFAGVLTDEQRWALIDWMRANNAGTALAADGAWPLPVQAPTFEASCAGGRNVRLEALRGQVTRIVFGPAHAAPGIMTIQVTSGARAEKGDGLCVSDSADVVQAYAVVTGVVPDALAGTQVLVDGVGWLRTVRMPGAGLGWDDPAALAAAVREVRAHPLDDPVTSHAGMRM